MFEIRRPARIAVITTAVAAFIWRGYDALHSLLVLGIEDPLLKFPLTVIFPAILIAIVLSMKPTRTREGLLMKFGTLLHLLLILCIPHFALHLALGFPFVFLTVELFETRMPENIKASLSKLVIS